LSQLAGVDEVAVVGDRHVADVGLASDGLGVSDGAGAGGAVPGVADAHVALEML